MCLQFIFCTVWVPNTTEKGEKDIPLTLWRQKSMIIKKKKRKIKKKKSFDWCRNYQNSKYTSNQDFSKYKSCQWKDQILFFKQQITEGLYFMCCMQSLLLQKVSYQF